MGQQVGELRQLCRWAYPCADLLTAASSMHTQAPSTAPTPGLVPCGAALSRRRCAKNERCGAHTTVMRSPSLAGTSAVAVPSLQGGRATGRRRCNDTHSCNHSASLEHAPQATPSCSPPERALLPRRRLHQQRVHRTHCRAPQQPHPPRRRQQPVGVCRVDQAVDESSGERHCVCQSSACRRLHHACTSACCPALP